MICVANSNKNSQVWEEEERGKQRAGPENRMLIKNQTNFLIAKRRNH